MRGKKALKVREKLKIRAFQCLASYLESQEQTMYHRAHCNIPVQPTQSDRDFTLPSSVGPFPIVRVAHSRGF